MTCRALVPALAALAALVLPLASCTKKKEDEQSKGTIGMTCMDLNNPFFQLIASVMEEKAKAAGYKLVALDGEGKAEIQMTQITDFIAQDYDAIFLNPADSKLMGEAVRRAHEAGVPVFTFDVQMEDPGVQELVTFHIGSDNEQGGRLAGESMMKATGDQGKVGIINKPDSNSCILRVKGFKDYLAENNSKLEIVSELNGQGKRTAGYTVATDMLQANSDLVGIFAINDPCALGAYEAVVKKERAGQVTIVAFDGSPDGKRGVHEKKLHDTPLQFPRQMAEGTVAAFLKHVQGEPFEKTKLIPCEHYYYEDAVKDENRDSF